MHQTILNISDQLLIDYDEVDERYNLSDWINKKTYRVADTPLTYRQINSLEQDNLLGGPKRNEKGWRRFSFKELVYLMIVNELKKYGFKHEQLNELWQCFFNESKDLSLNKHISEVAIGATLMQVEISLVFDNESSLSIYDPTALAMKPNLVSYLTLSLNAIVNNLLVMLKKAPISIVWSIQNEYLKSRRLNLSDKERTLVDLIRRKEYSLIKIKKSENETYTVYAEETKNNTGFTDQDVLSLLNDKDFQDIRLVKRDGKIVNLKVEATYKV